MRVDFAARQQLQNIYNEKCQQVFIFMAQHSSVLLLVEAGQLKDLSVARYAEGRPDKRE